MGKFRKNVTVGEIALVAVTRAALGAGIGLLVADKLSPERRKGAGWALFAVGAITTVPLLLDIFAGDKPAN